MRRILVSCLMLLMSALYFISARPAAQSTNDQPSGTWSGVLQSGNVKKSVALRFDKDQKGATAMFLDLPDLKFKNLGPIPIKQDGDKYKGGGFVLRFMPNQIDGTWSFDGNNLILELHPGPLSRTPTPEAITAPTAEPVWTFKTGGPIWSSPVATDGVVYFGSNDTSIYALQSRTGKQLWQFKTGGRVMGQPTVAAAYLYSLSDDGFLYKLQRSSGKLVWKFDTRGGSVERDLPSPKSTGYDYLTSAATVAHGIVYIGSADKNVYAIDDAGGTEKWHFETQGIVRSTPTVANGRVFFGSFDHFVYSVDAKDGGLQWKFDTHREVVSSPLVANGKVYIGSRSSNLFALDAATGKVNWKFFYWSSWVESSAREHRGMIYIGSSDAQQLFAIEPATGEPKWNVNLDGSVWSTPAITDRNVYIGVVGVKNYFVDHHGGFFAVDRVSGKVAWRFPMIPTGDAIDYGVASSPAVNQGLVFFGGLDGNMHAFRAD